MFFFLERFLVIAQPCWNQLSFFVDFASFFCPSCCNVLAVLSNSCGTELKRICLLQCQSWHFFCKTESGKCQGIFLLSGNLYFPIFWATWKQITVTNCLEKPRGLATLCSTFWRYPLNCSARNVSVSSESWVAVHLGILCFLCTQSCR